jgi:hypothetical protein
MPLFVNPWILSADLSQPICQSFSHSNVSPNWRLLIFPSKLGKGQRRLWDLRREEWRGFDWKDGTVFKSPTVTPGDVLGTAQSCLKPVKHSRTNSSPVHGLGCFHIPCLLSGRIRPGLAARWWRGLTDVWGRAGSHTRPGGPTSCS